MAKVAEQDRQHVLSFEEPEPLREHMLSAHTYTVPNAVLVRNADHCELDQFHIEAHRS